MNIAIEQNTLLVPPQLAAEIGTTEAIVLQQLHYWIEKAKEKGLGRIVEGVQWIYNTLDGWLEDLPFLKKYSLRKAFANLRNRDLIFSEQLDKGRWRRVTWYGINYDNLNKQLKALGLPNVRQSNHRECDPQTIEDATIESSHTETSSENSTEKLEKPISKKKEQDFGVSAQSNAKYDEWYQSALILGWVSGRDGAKVQMKRGLYEGRFFHWEEVAKNQEHFLSEPAPRQPGQFLRALAKGFGKNL